MFIDGMIAGALAVMIVIFFMNAKAETVRREYAQRIAELEKENEELREKLYDSKRSILPRAFPSNGVISAVWRCDNFVDNYR